MHSRRDRNIRMEGSRLRKRIRVICGRYACRFRKPSSDDYPHKEIRIKGYHHRIQMKIDEHA